MPSADQNMAVYNRPLPKLFSVTESLQKSESILLFVISSINLSILQFLKAPSVMTDSRKLSTRTEATILDPSTAGIEEASVENVTPEENLVEKETEDVESPLVKEVHATLH